MYPTLEQWRLFERYQDCPPIMTPQAFLQHWDLDYPDLARLVGVSRNTVAHWFSAGAGSRPPQDHYCRRLATIDFAWRNLERLPRKLLDDWCELSELSEETDNSP